MGKTQAGILEEITSGEAGQSIVESCEHAAVAGKMGDGQDRGAELDAGDQVADTK